MICIIAITVMGCSVFTTDHIDDKQEPDLAGPEKVAVNDFKTIDSLLKRQEGVVLISWAPDKSSVAYSVGDMGWDDQLYLWNTGELEPVEIEGAIDMLCEFHWSPNSEYVLADAGSSIVRQGYIINTKDCNFIDTISYIGTVYWSPDSKWIALGEESNIKPEVDIELGGTVDLLIYNILTKEKKYIAKGTAEYQYFPDKWDEDGLSYVKAYFTDPDNQELMIYVAPMNLGKPD